MTGGEAPETDWEQLVETPELYEAKLIALRLQEGGVDARVLDQTFHQEPMPSVRAISLVRVLVPRDQLAAGRKLLEEAVGLPQDAEPAGDED